jgi:hypothetical protein
MFIKAQFNFRGGFTLMETVIVTCLGLIVTTAVLSGFIFCSKNMLWLSNYATLNQDSQTALNKLTKDVRCMSQVKSYARTQNTSSNYTTASQITTSVTLSPTERSGSNEWVQLEYFPETKRLVRRKGGSSEVVLSGCHFLEFNLFQRTQTNGTFSLIPTTNAALAKVIEVRWASSRYAAPSREHGEVAQSAKIVMRAK